MDIIRIHDLIIQTGSRTYVHTRATYTFFDFVAAFPSILPDFLLEELKRIGLPAPIMSFIAALYQNSNCSLMVGGIRHKRASSS